MPFVEVGKKVNTLPVSTIVFGRGVPSASVAVYTTVNVGTGRQEVETPTT